MGPEVQNVDHLCVKKDILLKQYREEGAQNVVLNNI